MTGRKTNLWKRFLHLFREPTFHEILEDSAKELEQKGVSMNCPVCKKVVPFSDRCSSCGSPRHPPIDERI